MGPITHIPSETHWYVCDFNPWTQHLLPVHITQMKLSKKEVPTSAWDIICTSISFVFQALISCNSILCSPLLVGWLHYNARSKDFSTCTKTMALINRFANWRVVVANHLSAGFKAIFKRVCSLNLYCCCFNPQWPINLVVRFLTCSLPHSNTPYSHPLTSPSGLQSHPPTLLP